MSDRGRIELDKILTASEEYKVITVEKETTGNTYKAYRIEDDRHAIEGPNFNKEYQDGLTWLRDLMKIIQDDDT